MELQRGIYTRVATQLKLGKSGRSHVSRVASGERRSPRVETAIRAEMRRIDRAVEKHKKAQRNNYEECAAA
jgi:hypothetical protein